MFRPFTFIASALILTMLSARSQSIIIDGVTDRGTYNDTVNLRVQTNAGFSYDVKLNGAPIAAGVFHTINRMDYYDLTARRVNDTTSETTNVLVRFILLSSRRGDPERGLIEWVPLPPVSSAAAELAGAQLDLMAPLNYPAGLDIPVIARVEDVNGNARRVNGWVTAPGYESSAFRILRGVGFGLLAPGNAGTNVSFNGRLQTLASSKQINIESNTTWITVSGILGDTTWPADSRIHVTSHLTVPAGNTLTIGEGTVVRLNPGVNITNSGRTVINGTLLQPVVFTATNRVAPEQHAGAWGGWFLRGTAAELIANNTIMTGAGAAASISFSPGSSHRSEQPVLFVHNATARMTNCALINNAGQIGNGYFSTVIWERCLAQRAITVGEWEGCTNIVSRSAMIEFPSIDGIYNAGIANADYDGIYTIRGTNYFVDSLFGFCKDDAIDFGSGGAGTGVLKNCWIESALHEALAWSGEGRRTWTYDTVLMNNGQGIEAGWSTGANSPLVNASNLLSTANSVGARFGDNYTGTTGLGLKNGFLTITNSFILNNYRDVWGQVWDNTWNYRTGQMDIRSNFLTAPNTNHPANAIWNPSADGWRLASFMTTPPDAAVGVGLAAWNLQISGADLTNGIPVRLSSFTTNFVRVDYAIETPSETLTTGTLTFAPGETVKHIFGSPAALAGAATWRVVLQNPSGSEITGPVAAYVIPPQPQTNTPASGSVLSPLGATWRYLDDGSEQGTAWRATNFNDSTWSSGPGRLGFGTDAAATTTIRRYVTGTSGPQITNFYFRRAFVVTNPAEFATVQIRYQRDDGCIVYFNGNQAFANNMPGPPVTANTFASTTMGSATDTQRFWTNTLPASALMTGTNWLAVEVHQATATSSDLAWEGEVRGLPPSGPAPLERLGMARFGNELALHWEDPGYGLEQATEVTGPWWPVFDSSPVTVMLSEPQRFFRLKKP